MRKLSNERYNEIRTTELKVIVNSLYLRDLFSGEKRLHRAYGGLLVSSAIRRILQPKVIAGIRLSWGQILSIDGETLSSEIDLMACERTPLRHWGIIDYTIERLEFTRAIFEVKHSHPGASKVKKWGSKLKKFLSVGGARYKPHLGVIILWDMSINEVDEFEERELELLEQLPDLGHNARSVFILSGGQYDTTLRIDNLRAWDELANLIEQLTPPAYWTNRM